MGLSNRAIRQRMDFVRLWANYVKNAPSRKWSRQQNMLINSVMKSAKQDPDLYLRVKERSLR
jgi:hypothetical protein